MACRGIRLGELGQVSGIHGHHQPLGPDGLVPAIAWIATGAEVAFALFLLVGYKTELFARLSGLLLLAFAVSMTFSTGIKGCLTTRYLRLQRGHLPWGR